MNYKPVLVAFFIGWSGIATPAASADTPDTSIFSPGQLPECQTVDNLHIDDAGAIYVVCRRNGTDAGNPLGFTIFYVVKLEASGQRDPRWGVGGVATFQSSKTDIICGDFTCGTAYSSPARDGGFWIVLQGGRVLKFAPNGAMDDGFGHLYFAGSGTGEIPVSRTWTLVGVAQQPDGDLTSLSTSSIAGTQATTLLVRRLLPRGSFGGDTTYKFVSPGATIVAWSVEADNLDILLKSDGTQNTALLQRFVLTPDGRQSTPQGRIMPAFNQSGFVDPSFYTLGDGTMMYATSQRIYKWRTDGKPDTEFGVAGEIGFRTNPGGTFACDFQSPATLSPRLVLRANGDFTHHFRTGDQFRFGLICGADRVSLVTDHGRIDTFASPTIVPTSALTNQVTRNGGILYIGRDRPDLLGRIDGPGPVGTRARADVNVIEYHNESTDHYFITAHEHEVEFVDKGNAGPGWKRTGQMFGAWNIETPMPSTEPVCRYYGDATGGPNSHFYSAEKFECDALQTLDTATPKGKPAWRFERDAFRITVPANGQCPPNLTPVYRLYNRGNERGIESNHRYVTSTVEHAAMQAKGWASEGVHMCATRN